MNFYNNAIKNLWQWVHVSDSLLTANWVTSLTRYHQIFVGYSGGLDSTVLMHCLAQEPSLAQKIIAVHINHGLSANALHWQNHCLHLCQTLSIPLFAEAVTFSRQANIEEEARKARYEVFASLMTEEDCLVLGHHLDDQAETLLLQLFRGAGINGLGAMLEQKDFAKGQLLRPLLGYSRRELEDYALSQKLSWVDDESNQNPSYSRNYLRHQILPQLGQRWPGIVNNLVRTSQLCQKASRNLAALATLDCPALKQATTSLSFVNFKHLEEERIANILFFWLKSNQVKIPSALLIERIIHEVIQAKEDAIPLLQWKDFSIRRYQQTLYLQMKEKEDFTLSLPWSSFPKPLPLPGLGELLVEKRDKGLIVPKDAKLKVSFRQGGELFHWRGQTKQLKKLWQEWKTPPWLRDKIPLLYINEQLAAVIGYAINDTFYGEEHQNSYLIRLSS